MPSEPKDLIERIGLGNLITWVGMACAGVMAWGRMRFTQDLQAKQLEKQEAMNAATNTFREHTAVQLAQIDTKLDNYHTRIRKLEDIAMAALRVEDIVKRIDRKIPTNNNDE